VRVIGCVHDCNRRACGSSRAYPVSETLGVGIGFALRSFGERVGALVA
jgi:hypothetical protein